VSEESVAAPGNVRVATGPTDDPFRTVVAEYVTSLSAYLDRLDVDALLRIVDRPGRPGVVHVHSLLPLLSPAIHGAARSTGAAVVQTCTTTA
jgi:hypothetical protein